MKLTIHVSRYPEAQTTTIETDDALQQVITSVAAAVVRLSQAAQALADAVERETKDD